MTALKRQHHHALYRRHAHRWGSSSRYDSSSKRLASLSTNGKAFGLMLLVFITALLIIVQIRSSEKAHLVIDKSEETNSQLNPFILSKMPLKTLFLYYSSLHPSYSKSKSCGTISQHLFLFHNIKHNYLAIIIVGTLIFQNRILHLQGKY